MKVNGCGLF